MSAPLAAAGPSAYWYLSRGTGAVALLLLTASVVLGVLGSLRFAAAPRWPRFAIDALHRDVSLLVIALLLLHILTSVLDGFAPITLTDAVIPFASAYRPLWLGLGALSFDLLLALVITSLVRRRLGYRAWRAIHWLAYASWPVAVLHGLGTGTDTKVWWMLGLTIVCVGAVLVAVWVRIGRAGAGSERLRMPAFVLTLASVAGIAIFTLAGPLQGGWARRAGTPQSLLASIAPAANGGASTPSAAAGAAGGAAPGRAGAARFSAELQGKISQSSVAGGAVVDISLRLAGGARGRLRVRLGGAPIPGGGLSLTGSQVDLTADSLPAVMQGQIVSLQGQEFLARVSGAGSTLELRASLSIDNQTNAVTGTLIATPAG
ncbi:MAG: ferric reductase-like transmembrane domain-containing protein [Solirubrobacterales bacterium]|nr:ferric reductase-like transmembrane domain-containing protein [Solirubrobacterales bacterium]MBV9471765.1 ferric reductase-like transmembrane domain-containing protein [Solirubrobacterales bacterium]